MFACVAFGRYAASAMRHTTFRFALDPTSDQAAMLARHAGASRFADNQSLRLVTDALATAQAGLPVTVPWSGFDLIKAFNAWKISEGAGRVFVARGTRREQEPAGGFPQTQAQGTQSRQFPSAQQEGPRWP